MADGAEVLAGIARRAGRHLCGADPEPQGLRGGARRRRRRGGDLRLGLRELQPEEHQLPRSPRASSASRRSPRRPAPTASRCAAMSPASPTAPSRGRSRRRAVARVAERLFALGCREVSLGDTIGHGTPETVAAMLARGARRGAARATRRRISTTRAAARSTTSRSRSSCGLRVFDASCGGLGGCPYAPGRRGQRRDRARWPRGWPSAASRPASTRDGWPRPRPSRVQLRAPA